MNTSNLRLPTPTPHDESADLPAVDVVRYALAMQALEGPVDPAQQELELA